MRHSGHSANSQNRLTARPFGFKTSPAAADCPPLSGAEAAALESAVMKRNPLAITIVAMVIIGFICGVFWYNSPDQKLQRCITAEGQEWENKVQTDPPLRGFTTRVAILQWHSPCSTAMTIREDAGGHPSRRRRQRRPPRKPRAGRHPDTGSRRPR